MSDRKSNIFNKESREKVIEFLLSKWKDTTCDVCKEKNWQLSDTLVCPPSFDGGTVLGGKIMPQVVLNCTNCGQTKFFNAVLVGVLNNPMEKNDK